MIEPIGRVKPQRITFLVKNSQVKDKDRDERVFDKDDFDKEDFDKDEKGCPGYLIHVMPCDCAHKGCKLNYLA